MNLGLSVVLPLIIFLLIDLIILIDTFRSEIDSALRKIFLWFVICVLVQQFIAVLTYATDYQMLRLPLFFANLFCIMATTSMTASSMFWFVYLWHVLTNLRHDSVIHKVCCLIPTAAMFLAALSSPWTHWVFMVDANGNYHPGTAFWLQVVCPYIYCIVAILIAFFQMIKRDGGGVSKLVRNFICFMVPSLIGVLLQLCVFRGGYTQIGISIGMLFMYLEQYIEEIHENKRLLLLETANEQLEEQQTLLEEAVEEQQAQLDEIKNLNETLKENVDILSNAGFGIWKITIDSKKGHTMEASEKLQEIFGISDLRLNGVELYRFYHDRLEEPVDEIESDDYRTMMEGQVRARILKWHHPNKGLIYLSAGGTSYTEVNGRRIISGYCGDMTDQVMEERWMNEQLAEAIKQADAANAAKTTFLFGMSHDIRTPMNAITGFTTLMEKHIDDPELLKDYLEKIKSSSHFLLSLINNVLEVARIESGRAILEESVCDVMTLGNELNAVFAEYIKNKQINFIQTVDIEVQRFYADIVKINEIFLNLISNAFKYTPEGGLIRMDLKQLPCEQEGYVLLESTISDTGIGMSEEFLPHLFDVFSREKTVTEDKIEGTGLGMPIVKHLVELMNGTITVESKLGEGTTFVVTIPHRIAEQADDIRDSVEKTREISCRGMRALLAEDNDLNAEIAMEILTDEGFVVDRAVDGVECVEMMRMAAPNDYDIIFMDIQMPRMDGYTATREIRRMNDRTKKSIPIIAMTANAFAEDALACKTAGMNAHVAKPIDMQALFDTIRSVLREKNC